MDCALFAGIGQAEREEMLRCLDARRAKMVRGQALLEAGGPVREIGVVLRGAVQVRSTDFFGNQTILAQLGPGDLFGEAFVCAGLSRSPVEAVCQQDGEVLLLDYGRILGACPRACARHRPGVPAGRTLPAPPGALPPTRGSARRPRDPTGPRRGVHAPARRAPGVCPPGGIKSQGAACRRPRPPLV